MKSLVGKIGTLALVAMAGLAVNACSSSLEKTSPGESVSQGENVGSVGLKLQPVAGITVTQVHYVVTKGAPGSTPAPAIVSEGNLPTPGTAANFSFGIPLPVGTGYYISISGESAETGDDITCTGSYGPFAVTPNTSTPFDMTLLCVDNTSGQILSTVTVDTPACPRLIVDYAVAEPGTANVGENIAVHANARDLDNPTKPITYAWSIVDATKAGVGAFTPATAKDSSFKCANGSGGAIAIKVTANNGQCSKALQTSVSCKSLTCGNGILEPNLGENCDPGLDPTCPSDCKRVCGDGIIQSGETCDALPANVDVCIPAGSAGQCTLRPVACGDGYVNGAEKCDKNGNVSAFGVPLPAGSVCSADCLSIQGPVCGDGVKGGTEACDSGTGTNAAPVPALSRTCTTDCKSYSNDACVTCEQGGDCSATSDNCLGVGGAFSLLQQKQCTDVAICMETQGCLTGTGSLGKCYCGTLSTSACGAAPYDLTAAGAPNGPCAKLMQTGAPDITSNSQMLAALTAKGRPTGAAGQRLNCDKLNCTAECGLQ